MLHLIMASGLFKPSPYQEHALLVLLLCICLTPSSKDASFHHPIILMLHLIMASGWFNPSPYQDHA
jgi:hypothetical protein